MKRSAESNELNNTPSVAPTRNKKGKEKENFRAGWTETLRAYLVSLLVEFGAKEYRSDNGWNNRAWNEIIKRWTKKFPNAYYTKTQIKDQEQHLKKKFKSLKQLMTSSGLGWNPDLKMVEVVDDVWEDLLKTNKEAARQWHNKPFPYYDDLHNLYQGCIAEGLNKRGSNQYSLVNDLESPLTPPSPILHSQNEPARFVWEDDFINVQNTSPSIAKEVPNSQSEVPPVIDLASEDPIEMPLPSAITPPVSRAARQTSSNHEGPSNRVGRNKKAKTATTLFSPFNEDYYTFRREETNMYINAMKEIKEKKGNDKYGMNAAVKAFKELDGFTFDDYDKATTLFMSSVGFHHL